jgi:hypothetical protein
MMTPDPIASNVCLFEASSETAYSVMGLGAASGMKSGMLRRQR